MQKKMTRIMTGAGIGLAIGGVSAAISGSKSSGKTPMKKKASKAIRSVEDMLDGLQYMLK